MDLNCDCGESYGVWSLGEDDVERQLLDVVTSANVACGFHAGSPRRLAEVVELAAARGVVIGAQVSYPDLVGFGRRAMDVAAADLRADVLYQAGALDGLARAVGARVRYVKPHGALYHRITVDEEQAGAVLDAAAALALPLLTLPGGVAHRLAEERGQPVVPEGYADRGYTADGGLIPRGQPGAVLTDPTEVAGQAVRLARTGLVASLCVHGDTPGAPALTRAVRDALEAAGIAVAAFA